jgi:hypothetical protein
MKYPTKYYKSLPEVINALEIMVKFQSIHNVIRKDYLKLLRITEDNKSIEISFNALYRASLKSLFSFIEADIYCLNELDSYKNYSDNDSFIVKFKNKQIAKTWKKEKVQKTYFDSKLKGLKDLKKTREQLIHPKEIIHFQCASVKNL